MDGKLAALESRRTALAALCNSLLRHLVNARPFVRHARHDAFLGLVRGRQFVQVRQRIWVKRDGDFLARLALLVGERLASDVDVAPFHSVIIGEAVAPDQPEFMAGLG